MDVNVIKLKGLADKNRFRIIDLLLSHDFCVGALAHHLQISKAAVSQHLQILRKAGLVKGEKRGYWTHYSVEKSILTRLADDLKAMANRKSPETVCFRVVDENDRLCGKEVEKMCNCQCEHPEKIHGSPEECTPEQIKECHGDAENHPCEKKDD